MVPVLLVLVAVVLVATVLGVASGRLPADPLAEPVGSTPDTGLPDVPTAADVGAVRFDTALRGYRMDEVDSRLEMLQEVLAQREVELGQLQAERPTIAPEPAEPATTAGGAASPAAG